jgi:hypothetical protein
METILPLKQTSGNGSGIFKKTGTVNDRTQSVRPGVTEKPTDRVQAEFQSSPQKLILHASCKLQLPRSTVHVLHIDYICMYTNLK